MTTSEWFQLLAIIVQTVVLIVVFLQIRAEHTRHMKQATIDVINKDYAQARQELESQYGHEFLSASEVNNIVEDKAKYALITRLMGVMEFVCTGINVGIYDGELVYRLTGTSFIRNHHKLEAMINLRRQKESRNICIELEIVVAKFQAYTANANESKRAVIRNIFTGKQK